MLEVRAAQVEQTLDLRHGVGLGPAFGLTRARQIALQVSEGPVQHPLIEEPQTADGHVERAGRLGRLQMQMQEVGAQFLVAQAVR